MLSVKLALFATLGLLAVGISPAGAQPAGVDPAQIDISANGRCPDDKLATIKGIGADRVAALRRGLGYTFVLVPGTGHLTQASISEAPNVTAELQAFEVAILFGRDEGSGKILIALRDRKLCGWVKPEVLLLRDPRGDLRRLYGSGPEPLTAGQMPGARNQQNPITIKIVLHNGLVLGDKGTRVYQVPGTDKVLPSRKLSDIYEVFAVKRAVDPSTRELRNFYLAGLSPREASVRKTIIGWISEEDALLWNTRVTAFWREGGDIAAYWTPEKLAKRASDGQVMIRRFLDDNPHRISRRFPVIDSEPNQATILKRLGMAAAGRSQDINKMIESYVVAVPFKTCRGGKGLDCHTRLAALHFPARSPSGVDTFNFWLAMDAASLNSLVRASNSICDTIDTTNAVANLRTALLNLIGDATRDTTLLKSPRDFFEQRLFIPGFHLDPLLTKTFEQLEDEFRDPEPAKTEERKRFFCRKAHLLTLLERGQKVEDVGQLRWVAETKRWTQPKTAVKPYQWFHADEVGSPVYYVPLDYLP